MGDYSTKNLLTFESGDFVLDLVSNEVGLLLQRFNLVESSLAPVWAWEILWSGARTRYSEGLPKRTPYTEESLKNMVIEGVLTYYKNN